MPHAALARKRLLHAAQRLSPDSGETHLAAARFYHYGKRDLDHALEQLDIAARLLPNSPDVFDLSAKIERRLGRWNEALRHFAKANELDPRNPTALNNIVLTYGLLRHYKNQIRSQIRRSPPSPKQAVIFGASKRTTPWRRETLLAHKRRSRKFLRDRVCLAALFHSLLPG